MPARKISQYDPILASALLASDYFPVVAPGETLPEDRNKRMSFTELEKYLFGAGNDVSLIADTISGNSLAGAQYIDANDELFIGIKYLGGPPGIIVLEATDMISGSQSTITIDDLQMGINLNDGGVIGYQMQDILNASNGIRQMNFYDLNSALTQYYSVSGGLPLWQVSADDFVNNFNIAMLTTGFFANSGISNLVLANTDTGYLGSLPLAGAYANDGTYDVVSGVINAAGTYLIYDKIEEITTGNNTNITLLNGSIEVKWLSGSDGSQSHVAVTDISVLMQKQYGTGGSLGNADVLVASGSGFSYVDTYAGDGANEYAGIHLDGLTSEATILSDNGVNASQITVDPNGVDINVGASGIFSASIHNTSGTAGINQITSRSDTSAPTVTAVTNCTVSAPTNHKFIIVGREVVGSFRVSVDPTAGSAATAFRFSLPVASALVNADDVSGVAFSKAIGVGGEVTADTTNDQRLVEFISDAGAANQVWTVFYQYTIKT